MIPAQARFPGNYIFPTVLFLAYGILVSDEICHGPCFSAHLSSCLNFLSLSVFLFILRHYFPISWLGTCFFGNTNTSNLSRSLLVYRFCPFTDLPHLFRNGDRDLHTGRGPWGSYSTDRYSQLPVLTDSDSLTAWFIHPRPCPEKFRKWGWSHGRWATWSRNQSRTCPECWFQISCTAMGRRNHLWYDRKESRSGSPGSLKQCGLIPLSWPTWH